MKYEFKVGDTGLTRHGKPYRVIAVDLEGERSVVAVIRQGTDDYPVRQLKTGKSYKDREDPLDLMPPAQKISVWVNVYGTKEQADDNAGFGRIACIELKGEYTPGGDK